MYQIMRSVESANIIDDFEHVNKMKIDFESVNYFLTTHNFYKLKDINITFINLNSENKRL